MCIGPKVGKKEGRTAYSGNCKVSRVSGTRGHAQEQQTGKKNRDQILGTWTLFGRYWAATENFYIVRAMPRYFSSQKDY